MTEEAKDKVDVLSKLMYDQFKELKEKSEVLKDFEEVPENEDTQAAIKELYPDMDLRGGVSSFISKDRSLKSKHSSSRKLLILLFSGTSSCVGR